MFFIEIRENNVLRIPESLSITNKYAFQGNRASKRLQCTFSDVNSKWKTCLKTLDKSLSYNFA